MARVLQKTRGSFFNPRRAEANISLVVAVFAALSVVAIASILYFHRATLAEGDAAQNKTGMLAHLASIATRAFQGLTGSGQDSRPIAVVSLDSTSTADETAQFVGASSSSQNISAADAVKIKNKKSGAKTKAPLPENPKNEAAVLADSAANPVRSLQTSHGTSSPAKIDAEQENATSSKAVKNKKSSASQANCGFYGAASPSHILVINEIAWMGSVPRAYESSTLAGGNEWMELKNVSGGELNLSGWRLMDQSGKIDILFENTKVAPEGLLLLERTDDETIPWIKADKIYTGALPNSGAWLALYDGSCNKVDEVNALSGWPAGDNGTKQTMERGANFSWHTSVNPGGTPRQENTGGVSAFISPSTGSTSSSAMSSLPNGSSQAGGGGGGSVPSTSSGNNRPVPI